jgi:hypothetical protein
MIRMIRYSLLAAAATALVACGGGPKLGGGKEGAAKAMFVASQNSNAALQRATTGQALPIRELASYADNTVGEFLVKCAKSGELKVKIDFLTYLEDIEKGEFKYEVEFNDCNEDGLNALDGNLAIEFKTVPGTIDVSLKFKGKVEFSGEVDDYIDADVTLAVSSRGLDQTTGSVGITLTGEIETSEATYTYDGSPLTITVEGGLPIAEGEGKP